MCFIWKQRVQHTMFAFSRYMTKLLIFNHGVTCILIALKFCCGDCLNWIRIHDDIAAQHSPHCWSLSFPIVNQFLFSFQKTHHLELWFGLRGHPKITTERIWLLWDLSTLQSMVNAKLSQQTFWHCYESEPIKTNWRIPHNLYVSVKVDFSLLWIKAYPGLS